MCVDRLTGLQLSDSEQGQPAFIGESRTSARVSHGESSATQRDGYGGAVHCCRVIATYPAN